ncbi:MAG: transporter [Massilia sp.]|nr:transporter [Massilia sp.]
MLASYSVALHACLLVYGALSDFRGRRAVVLFTMVLELCALLLFLHADSVASLIAARLLQGVATGIATSAVGAALIDIDQAKGALVNSAAPMVGMGIGALGTSVLVQFAPAPTMLVFELLLAVFAVQLLGVWFMPETVVQRVGALQSLWPRIAIPAQARSALWKVMPVNTAQWALGGFYLSLGPSVARVVTGSHAPVIGGAAIAALVLPSAVAILFVRARSPRFALMGGAAMLGLGLAISLAGIASLSGPLFFIGTVVGGFGFGASFNGSLRSVVALASPQQRGELMAGFFTFSYLAFSVPAMLAGVAVGRFGLQATGLGYGLALLALVAGALSLLLLQRPLPGSQSGADK